MKYILAAILLYIPTAQAQVFQRTIPWPIACGPAAEVLEIVHKSAREIFATAASDTKGNKRAFFLNPETKTYFIVEFTAPTSACVIQVGEGMQLHKINMGPDL